MWAKYTEEKMAKDSKGFYLLSSVHVTDYLSCGFCYDFYKLNDNYDETDITFGAF